jgi:hypothetical protein
MARHDSTLTLGGYTVPVIHPQSIYDFGIWSSGVANQFTSQVQSQMSQQGCNKSGFDGLLWPLQGAMDVLRGITEQVNKGFSGKLVSIAQGLEATASQYQGVEQHNTNLINNAPTGG